MKKKAKDLTIEEIINFSQKYGNRCTECSFKPYDCEDLRDYLISQDLDFN